MPESPKSTAEVRPRPDPNEKLVKVFDAEQESEAMVVKGLLESAGIDSDLTSLSATQDVLPGVGGTIILVREEDAERANRMIAEFQQAPEGGDDDGDEETAEIDIAKIDISEEPPRKG
jgi:Putative prokaryotic signal transducing protein